MVVAQLKTTTSIQKIFIKAFIKITDVKLDPHQTNLEEVKSSQISLVVKTQLMQWATLANMLEITMDHLVQSMTSPDTMRKTTPD